MRSIALVVALPLAFVGWTIPASAQEASRSIQFFKTASGGVLWKDSAYEGGSSIDFAIACRRGDPKLALMLFGYPAQTTRENELPDIRPLFGAGAYGVKRSCGPTCRLVVKRQEGDETGIPNRTYSRSITWAVADRGAARAIAIEPKRPEWYGFPEFAAGAQRSIAKFHSACRR